MKTVFLLVKVLTGMFAAGALGVLVLAVFLRSTLAFAKEGVGVLGYVVALFTSGFTKGTPPPEPEGWVIAFPQVGLALLFLAMLVSVFLPEARAYLHGVAVAAAVAGGWLLVLVWTGPRLEILCLPAFAVWAVYYAMCLWGPGSGVGR